MIEMVAHFIFDHACGFGTGQAILGLTLKLRIANKDRQHDLASGHDVFGLNLRCPLLTRQFAKRPDAFCKGSAQTRFMRAAVRCRNGVAVPAIAAVGPEWPGDGPFHSSRAIGEIMSSVEEIGCGALTSAGLFAQMVSQAAGELEYSFGGCILGDALRREFPPDLDTTNKIGRES